MSQDTKMLKEFDVYNGRNLNNLVIKSTKNQLFQENLCETGKGRSEICSFCKRQYKDQDLYKHTLDCEAYENALTQTTCPVCHVQVEGPMTLHLEDHIKEKQTSDQIQGKIAIYIYLGNFGGF